MTRNLTQHMHKALLTGLLVSSSLLFLQCSSKKEGDSESTSAATADSSVFGRQGDTLNSSSMNAPQQAPPDSVSNRQGAVVPAEVKVRVKK